MPFIHHIPFPCPTLLTPFPTNDRSQSSATYATTKPPTRCFLAEPWWTWYIHQNLICNHNRRNWNSNETTSESSNLCQLVSHFLKEPSLHHGIPFLRLRLPQKHHALPFGIALCVDLSSNQTQQARQTRAVGPCPLCCELVRNQWHLW